MSGALNQFLSPEQQAPSPRRQNVDVYAGDIDTLHDKLVRWFEEAERASLDARQLSERDRSYVDGDQWTTPEREALRKRGQPEITINYCRRKIDLLCGMERKARTDAKAFPRDPTEDDRADAATQALRFVSDDNDFSVIRSSVYENMLVEGFGGIEMGLEDDGKGGANITLAHVGWERIFHDPHARAVDFGDARYLGLVIWMDQDQAEELYPDAGDVIGDSFAHFTGSYDDRPSTVLWTDTLRERTRVVQCHWVEKGTWWSCTYARMGILSPPAKSKFKDRKGKSACPLILQSAYIDRENRRYGIVRDLISEQDEINKRRSKALHLLSVRSVVADQGAVQDVDRARREVAKPDGYVEVTPNMRFEIHDGAELAAGQFQLLQHATQEMQASGPNASLTGTDQRELSGRAILANQAGGMAQNEPLADSLRMWSRRVYEMGWMAVREFWTAGKWVRVTDDLGSTRWVGINQKVTVQDELAAMPEAHRAMVMQRMQPPLQPGDPRLQQVIRTENDITDLDVDITVEEGIPVPTMQAEEFQTLTQLASVQPGLIPGDVLIAASSLKNKDKLLEMMKAHQQAQSQQQAQQQQIGTAHAQAQIGALQAKGAADAALAKERTVSAASGVHAMHQDFAAPPYGQPFQAPPDAPSAPGTVQPDMPPEIKALHDHAALMQAHAKSALDNAKAMHEMHKAAHTIATTHQVHNAITNPPEPVAAQ